MRQLKQQFKRLSSTEKTMFISFAICFFFTFFSWFYQRETSETPFNDGSYERFIHYNAYKGVTAVIGYFYAFFILSGLGTIILSVKDKFVSRFIDKQPWFYLLITGESLFLLVLSFLIYTSYSLQFSSAGSSFGIYFVIISNIVALFAAHFFFLKKRKYLKDKVFREQMHGTVNLETDQISHSSPSKESKKENKEEAEKQMSFGDLS